MPDKLGALVSVPAPAIVSDPESRAPKRERDIEIMFEREREREREREIPGKKTPLGEFLKEHYLCFIEVSCFITF